MLKLLKGEKWTGQKSESIKCLHSLLYLRLSEMTNFLCQSLPSPLSLLLYQFSREAHLPDVPFHLEK